MDAGAATAATHRNTPLETESTARDNVTRKGNALPGDGASDAQGLSAQEALALYEAIDIIGANQDYEADEHHETDEMDQSFFVRGTRLPRRTHSSTTKTKRPPSKAGMGRMLRMARLMLSKMVIPITPTKPPSLANSPVIWAMPIGPEN